MSRPEPEPREADPPGDPETVARAICLRMLTARARTRAELADALRRRGVPDDAAGAVLDRFTEVGLIDDAAVAQAYAQAQHRDRGLAGRAVATKLRRRGVAEPIVRDAVATLDPESEAEAARRLVRRRLPGMAHLDEAAQARRLLGLLARRGYPAGLAWQVVREAVGELSDTPDG